MVAYAYTMPVGYAGHLSRGDLNSVVESDMLDGTTLTPTGYGIAVKLVSGKLQTMAVGDTAPSVYGILVREYPTGGSLANSSNNFSTNIPNIATPQGVLKSGYINVVCNNFGTNAPTKGGIVYIRIATAGTGKPIGGFEAAADSTNTIVLTNAYFMGGADAFGNTEIAYNL